MIRLWNPASLDDALMTERDLDEVMAIEQSVYPHPWSRGNFIDALAGADQAWVMRERDCARRLLGYFLLMPVVDEAHLLNLAISVPLQGQGLGHFLLDLALARARNSGMASVLLEVRPSNIRALELYRRRGFSPIGRRKAYYPAANGEREDAIVMRLEC